MILYYVRIRYSTAKNLVKIYHLQCTTCFPAETKAMFYYTAKSSSFDLTIVDSHLSSVSPVLVGFVMTAKTRGQDTNNPL